MKRKLFSVLFALVLVLSFSLVTAVPAMANGTTYNVTAYTLDDGVAWSTAQAKTGSSSVLLGASGDYVDFVPPAGTTLDDLSTIATGWGWWYHSDSIGPGLELRFAGPNFDTQFEHVDVTVNTAELTPATGEWTEVPVISTSTATCYGNDSTGTEFADSFAPGEAWVASTGNNSLADIVTIVTGYTGLADAGDWPLTRVRAEIYASGTVYIDDIEIADTTYYGMIQDAIDVATTGDTIKVYPGTYTEEIKINEELTLTGVTAAGADNWTTSTVGATATTPTISYGAAHMVAIDADNVTIQGINIDATHASAVRAIHFRSGGAALTDNTVIQYNTFTGACRNLNISDGRTVTDLTVIYNKFTGDGTEWGNWLALGDADGGIAADTQTYNIFSYNTVTGNQTAFLELGSKAIEDCLFDNNNFSFGFVLTEDPELDGEDYGDIVLTNNTFTGDPSTAAFEIDGTVEDADWEGGSLTADDLRINYNNFTGYLATGTDTISIVNTPTAPIDAQYNYWGDPSGPTISTNARGTGADVDIAADVDYEPWLHTIPATVVAANTRYYAYNLVSLQQGWNILSTPIALDEQAATWGNYKALGVPLALTDIADGPNAYYFNNDGSTQSWAQPGDSYVLRPVDAIYVKMASAQKSPILFNPTVSAPSKMLYPGWNLVSASYFSDWDAPDLTSVSVEIVLASVYYATGASNIGYSVVTSPAVNQTAWSGVREAAIDTAFSTLDMIPTEGYWVHMVNGGTLVGTVFTPVSPLLALP